jgi:hypothetical protein
MRLDRIFAASLLSLPALYPLALVVAALPPADVGVPSGILVCALVALLWSRASERDDGRGIALLIGFLVVIAATLSLGGGGVTAGTELAVGGLLGAPLVALAVTWRPREAPGYRLLAFAVALSWGILLLATEATLAGGAVTAPTYASAFATTVGNQLTGLAGVVGRTGFTSLPAQSLFDPVYVGVSALAVLGLLITGFRPQTGAGSPLPTAPRSGLRDVASRELGSVYAFTAAQRAAYRARSLPEPSRTIWPPGLLPIAGGAAAAALFLLVATVAPRWALLGTSSAIVVVFALLAVRASDFVRSRLGPMGRTPLRTEASPGGEEVETARAAPVSPSQPRTAR